MTAFFAVLALAVSAHSAQLESADFSQILKGAKTLNSPAAQAARLRLAEANQAPAAPAVNAGFRGLGPKGTAGKVAAGGFLNLGGGSYWVLENSNYLVVLKMRTGFIDATFTLKRDPAGGKDSIAVQGRVNDVGHGGWKNVSGASPGQVVYDAARDAGFIKWALNGQPQQSAFKGGGRQGSRSMTIDFDGNPHEFSR